MRKPLILACACVLIGSALVRAEPMTWELRNGTRWDQVTGPASRPTTAPSPDLTLNASEKMIAAGQGGLGAKSGIQWLKANPKDAPQRDRALFLVAQGFFIDGKRINAFYYLDELMDEYPDSRFYQQSLQKQYDIADEYLKGYKRIFIYFPILSAEDEAVDMLYRIQQRAPGSLLAEKALLRTADWYYASSEFDLAADAYAAYERSYPRSPYLPRVRLRRAYSNLAQFRSTWHDPTPLMDARVQLLDIAQAYPELAEQEDLSDLIRRVNETFAEKIYRAADWFRRTDKPDAAVYYYRFVISTFPDSPKAEQARKRMKDMPLSALQKTPPHPGDGYSPPTDVSTPEER